MGRLRFVYHTYFAGRTGLEGYLEVNGNPRSPMGVRKLGLASAVVSMIAPSVVFVVVMYVVGKKLEVFFCLRRIYKDFGWKSRRLCGNVLDVARMAKA